MCWLRVLAILGAVSLLTACAAPNVRLDPAAWKANPSGTRVLVVAYQPEKVSVVSAGFAVGGGLLGAALDWITQLQPSPDAPPGPATLLARKTSSMLGERTGVEFTVVDDLLPRPVPDKIAEVPGLAGRDFVLQTWIPTHTLIYRPLAWSTYQYLMQGQTRLTRVRDGAVVWAHRCTIGGSTGDEALQVGAADPPARLQAVLEEATRRCAETFVTDFVAAR